MNVRTHDEVDLELVVGQVREVADGVREVVLEAPDGTPLPLWTPGAHVDLTCGEVVRQFSLCGDPGDWSRWTIGVLREVDGRGGSAYVHDRLAHGQRVHVRGPRNHFTLEDASSYLFIAGGIGITPLLPMIAEVDAAGRPWTLVYGGRRRASMAYAERLVEEYGDRVLLRPQDEVGLIDLQAHLGAAGAAAVYCCGPEPLLKALESACSDRPAGALHVERFSPKEQNGVGRDDAFEVELSESGRTLTVPAGCSVLTALQEAGVPVLFSCTEGTCGTCETGVLEGVVDHRDSLLTDDERAANDVMFICVSRALTPRLVLEL